MHLLQNEGCEEQLLLCDGWRCRFYLILLFSLKTFFVFNGFIFIVNKVSLSPEGAEKCMLGWSMTVLSPSSHLRIKMMYKWEGPLRGTRPRPITFITFRKVLVKDGASVYWVAVGITGYVVVISHGCVAAA